MRRPLIFGLVVAVISLLAVGAYAARRGSTPSGPATITFACGIETQDWLICEELARRFEVQSGHRVVLRDAPDRASLHIAVLQELTLTRSTDVDVFMVDVIWPGILANDLLDLSTHFSAADLADFFPRIVGNNTVNGRLVAMPYHTDAGLLYYRSDLLGKYGYASPPQTWDELTAMAGRIQEGERSEGNAEFWGFVWQGAQYEGLTCDALEWIFSEGGGTVVEADGSISVRNANAERALQRAQDWVGTITPPEVTRMAEAESLDVWRTGNAAFMRNWPYAYSISAADGSPVQGRFNVTTLPRGQGQPAATLGGWQLAVNRHSRNPQAAIDFVRFMTSAEAQKYRALGGAYNPTRRSLYADPEVLARFPFFAQMPAILDNAVARPSTVTAAAYDDVSTAFHTEVHRVLQGTPPRQALASLEGALQGIRGESW